MSDRESGRTDLIVACQQLLHRAALLADARRFEELLRYFESDCVFEAFGREYVGHAGLTKLFATIGSKQDVRHSLTNMMFDVTSPGVVNAITYVSLHRVTHDAATKRASYTLEAMVTYHDLLRAHGDGWKIAQRQVVPFVETEA